MSNNYIANQNIIKLAVAFFNISYIHPKIISKYIQDPITKINCPKLKKNLSNYIFSTLNINVKFEDLVKNILHTWILCSWSKLRNLQRFLGALHYSFIIKKTINKDSRDKIVNYIGKNSYSCIIKRSALYKPLLPTNIKIPVGEDLLHDITLAGGFFLRYCLDGYNNLEVMKLRLDPEIFLDKASNVEEQCQHRLLILCNKLLNNELL